MEIEGSFGILARPSNQVAREIVHLSRSLTSRERHVLGGKELDPISSTAAAKIARDQYDKKNAKNKTQPVSTNMLTMGHSTSGLRLSQSLPSLLPRKTGDASSPGDRFSDGAKDGPIIASVTCTRKDVRTFWETLRPKHVIELHSIKGALEYFAKPVENVLNLPNIVIGDIHLSTSAGQSLLSYLGILKIPYVLIGTRGHAAKAQLYGAIDFVYKPIDAYRLKHAFNLAMNKLARSRAYAIQDIIQIDDKVNINTNAKEHYESSKRISRSRRKSRRMSSLQRKGIKGKKRSESPSSKSSSFTGINFSQIEDGGWKVGNEDRGKGIWITRS